MSLSDVTKIEMMMRKRRKRRKRRRRVATMTGIWRVRDVD